LPKGVNVIAEASSSVSIWSQINVLVNLVLLVGFVALLCYAGWKVFRWLRKWNP
jgi:hypothetical protein